MNFCVDRVKLFCESLSSVAAAASPGVKAKSPDLYGLTGNKLSPKLLLNGRHSLVGGQANARSVEMKCRSSETNPNATLPLLKNMTATDAPSARRG